MLAGSKRQDILSVHIRSDATKLDILRLTTTFENEIFLKKAWNARCLKCFYFWSNMKAVNYSVWKAEISNFFQENCIYPKISLWQNFSFHGIATHIQGSDMLSDQSLSKDLRPSSWPKRFHMARLYKNHMNKYIFHWNCYIFGASQNDRWNTFRNYSNLSILHENQSANNGFRINLDCESNLKKKNCFVLYNYSGWLHFLVFGTILHKLFSCYWIL